MINIRDKRCLTPLCGTHVRNKKYKGYCLFCYVNHPDFQNEPVVRNYKSKERYVHDYIKEHFSMYTIIWDKRVDLGCSLRRPDFLIDFGGWVLIIEVDENRHENYDSTCDNKRLCQLSQDISHRNMIMIRFNPDDYINSNNENVTSCWGYNKLGMAVVKKSKQKEWKYRLDCLKQRIEYWVSNPIDKMIHVDLLFYDGYK
jgi:hypothetical protein